MKNTTNIELVETGEIAKSLKRLKDIKNPADWKRVLNHALLMSGVIAYDKGKQARLREALDQA